MCQIEDGYLAELVERKEIERQDRVVRFFDGEQWVDAASDSLIAMNMWALTPEVFTQLEEDIIDFVENEVLLDVAKSEWLIPITIAELIQKGKAKVNMYASHDTWQGVTYKEDKPGVMEDFKSWKKDRLYPSDCGDKYNLWGDGKIQTTTTILPKQNITTDKN